MIAFEVSVNGKRVCVAGAEDLGVLSTIITACGKLGRKSVPYRPDETSSEVHYSVGGLTSRPNPKDDHHLKWKSAQRLAIGDVITVRVVETKKASRVASRTKAKDSRRSS